MNPDESKQDVFETPVDQKKEARRIRLLENLKKGRETALANRKKKALYNKLQREEKNDAMDMLIKDKLNKKTSLQDENQKLKDQLLAMQQPKPIKEPAEPIKVTPPKPAEIRAPAEIKAPAENREPAEIRAPAENREPAEISAPAENRVVFEPKRVMNVFNRAPW